MNHPRAEGRLRAGGKRPAAGCSPARGGAHRAAGRPVLAADGVHQHPRDLRPRRPRHRRQRGGRRA
eukprot:6822490-Pyramimonas_sp.AAC.1